MAITGMKLRTCTPNGDWRSAVVAAPSDVIEGEMLKIESTVGMWMQDTLAGYDVAFLYHSEKILLPKKTGSGQAIAQFAKVYWDDVAKKVTGVAAANLWVGICLVAALIGDTTVEVDFKGDKAT